MILSSSKGIRTCNTFRDRSLRNFFSKFGRVLSNEYLSYKGDFFTFNHKYGKPLNLVYCQETELEEKKHVSRILCLDTTSRHHSRTTCADVVFMTLLIDPCNVAKFYRKILIPSDFRCMFKMSFFFLAHPVYKQPVPYLPVNASMDNTIYSKSGVFQMPAFTKSTSC